MADSILLDTCAALWLMGGEPISQESRKAILSAGAAHVGVYVSPFSAWEIGTLIAKQRLQLTLSPEIWFERLLAMPGVRLAELTPMILLASTALPGSPPADPADRIIAATARVQGFVVVTRDRKLLDYAREGHIRAIAC
ncbi:MAG: type II toxin-antitoxin system VapC family toxin [Terracidiphilus sp.]